MEHKENVETISVPRGTGEEGFLAAIRKILRKPRVQYIHIDSRGSIKYSWIAREGENIEPLGVDFESLLPSTIVRANEIEEIQPKNDAAGTVSALFNAAVLEHLHPVGFVLGGGSTFWSWHQKSVGVELKASYREIYGLPYYVDEQMPDYVMTLCCAFTRESTLVDTRKSFKVILPQPHELEKL
jgi:hypothetical protein